MTSRNTQTGLDLAHEIGSSNCKKTQPIAQTVGVLAFVCVVGIAVESLRLRVPERPVRGVPNDVIAQAVNACTEVG